MKQIIKTTLIFLLGLIASIIWTAGAYAATSSNSPNKSTDSGITKDITKDFDNLGGNKELLDRAKAYDQFQQVRLVQKRTVDRQYRWEITLDYGSVVGGEPYLKTANLGAQVNFHINNSWSIGYRQYQSFNELSPEGERMYNDAMSSSQWIIPQMDYPISTRMFVLNWYPMYGKFNLLDLAIVHFDVYTILGVGQLQLSSGETQTKAIGLGLGLWFSQHLTSHFELLYQTYSDKVFTGPRDMNIVTGALSVGVLL